MLIFKNIQSLTIPIRNQTLFPKMEIVGSAFEFGIQILIFLVQTSGFRKFQKCKIVGWAWSLVLFFANLWHPPHGGGRGREALSITR